MAKGSEPEDRLVLAYQRISAAARPFLRKAAGTPPQGALAAKISADRVFLLKEARTAAGERAVAEGVAPGQRKLTTSGKPGKKKAKAKRGEAGRGAAGLETEAHDSGDGGRQQEEESASDGPAGNHGLAAAVEDAAADDMVVVEETTTTRSGHEVQKRRKKKEEDALGQLPPTSSR